MPSQIGTSEPLSSVANEKQAVAWIMSCLGAHDVNCADIHHLAYHLVGTDRAFGLYFPEFFLASLPLDVALRDRLRRVFLASRAYLIADDALRDHDRTAGVRKVLGAAAPRFRSECLDAGKGLGLTHAAISHLLDRRERLGNWAYRRDASYRPSLAGTCLRCSLWYIVFDVLRRQIPVSMVRQRRRLFSEALFLLQLADDYADIDIDLEANGHRSLLAWGTTSHSELFGQIPRPQLRGYALLSMYILSQQLACATGVPLLLRLWAESIQDLISISADIGLDQVVTRLFSGRLPEAFRPPLDCPGLVSIDLAGIALRGMNGVSLSAESVNSFATRRALAQGELP